LTIALEGVEAGGDDGQRRSQLMGCIGREAALDDKPSYDGLRPSLINGRLGARADEKPDRLPCDR
jgi:hypothetical protein